MRTLFAVLLMTSVASAQMPYSNRVHVRRTIGDGVGHSTSYTSVESFAPLFETQDLSISFMEVRGHFDDRGDAAANLGFGYRQLITDEVLVGGSLWYDYRNLGYFDFHSLGVSAEVMTDWVEFRSNLYAPSVGHERDNITPFFTGNKMMIGAAQVAMTGIDAEIGLRLPAVGDFQGGIFGGVYHFAESGVQNFTGWRARGELAVSDFATVGVIASDDKFFGSTLVVGIDLHRLVRLSPIAERDDYPPVYALERRASEGVVGRLAERTRRMDFIVTQSIAPVVATLPNGSALNFLHVRGGGTAAQGDPISGGPGTFESPFTSINQPNVLMPSATDNTVVFNSGGGTFNFPMIPADPTMPTVPTIELMIPAGAQLFGANQAAFVNTQLGAVQLPGSGIGFTSRITGDVEVKSGAIFQGFTVSGMTIRN